MITFLLVVFGIVSNAAASVLIKYAMMPERKVSISEPLSIILNIPLWAGLLFYGIAFVLYALTLQRLPLNVTHPVLTCGAISMVAVLSDGSRSFGNSVWGIFYNNQDNWSYFGCYWCSYDFMESINE